MRCIASLLLILLTVLLVKECETQLSYEDTMCPPWFVYNSDVTFHDAPDQFKHCVCGHSLPYQIKCNAKNFTVSLLSGNCAFWSNTTGRTTVGHCPYIFPQGLLQGQLMKLPQNTEVLNHFICKQLSRETWERGCGICVNGTGPSVTSLGSICTQCDPINILYYILLHYLPATVIFLVILIGQVDLISTPILYYILYCSIWVVYLQTPDGFSTYVAFLGKYKYTLRVVFILHSIVTLDPLYFISPPLCIKESLRDIYVPYFEMTKTLYPFILLLLAYMGIQLHARDFKPIVMVWKPLYWILTHLKISWQPHVSLVQAFTTIFFISYMKLLSLVTVPFILTARIDDNGAIVENSKVTYIDPTVPIGDSKHALLIVASVALLVFIILPPILLLTIYPTRFYRMFQSYLSPRMNIAIKIFVSTAQGLQKDGTNGEKDFRVLSGLIPVLFLAIIAIQYSFNSLAEISYKQPLMVWHINAEIFLITTLLLAIMRPHKLKVVNNIGLCLVALLGIGAILHIFLATYFPMNMFATFLAVSVVSIPHFVFYGYIIYRLSIRCGVIREFKKCLMMAKSTEMEEQAILSRVRQ